MAKADAALERDADGNWAMPCDFANGHHWHHVTPSGARSSVSPLVRCCLCSQRAIVVPGWMPFNSTADRKGKIPSDALHSWHRIVDGVHVSA